MKLRLIFNLPVPVLYRNSLHMLPHLSLSGNIFSYELPDNIQYQSVTIYLVESFKYANSFYSDFRIH